MPASTTEYVVAAQDRTLSALRQSQSAVVEAVEGWAKAVESAAPELPAIPVLESLPSPEEIIQTSFDFYGKVLAAQREFAQNLVAAAAPVVKTTPVETPKAPPSPKAPSA
jgi:hypothetical protein